MYDLFCMTPVLLCSWRSGCVFSLCQDHYDYMCPFTAAKCHIVAENRILIRLSSLHKKDKKSLSKGSKHWEESLM